METVGGRVHEGEDTPSKSPVKCSTGGWEENTCLFGYYPLNLLTVLFITPKTKTLFIDLYLLDPVQVSPPPFSSLMAGQGRATGWVGDQ